MWIALHKREGGNGVFLLQICRDHPADGPVRHRMLCGRQRLIFANDLPVITLRIQGAKPIDTGKDDVFSRLRVVLPAGKQGVIAI